LTYTYWEGENGWLLGYLNDYPKQWTQGKNIPELEKMLIDLYENFQDEAKHKKEGIGNKCPILKPLEMLVFPPKRVY
jgi:hypothetical protein